MTSPANHTDWEYVGAKIDAGVENSFPIPQMVLDRANKQVFVSVPNQNEVFVADATTHQRRPLSRNRPRPAWASLQMARAFTSEA